MDASFAQKMLEELLPPLRTLTAQLYKRHALVRQLGTLDDAHQATALAMWRRLTRGRPLPDPVTKGYLRVFVRRSLARAALNTALVHIGDITAHHTRGCSVSTEALHALTVRSIPDGGNYIPGRESRQEDPNAMLAGLVRAKLVTAALEALSPRWREILATYYGLEGRPRLSTREAAKALGLTRTAFLGQLERARRALRRELLQRGMDEWL